MLNRGFWPENAAFWLKYIQRKWGENTGIVRFVIF